MRAYRSLQALLASIFAVYLVLALVEVVSGDKGIVFPVFSWALFESVPNRFIYYTVRVHSLDGHELEPARDVLDMEESIPGAASAEVRATVQALGEAIAARDEEHIAAARRTLERLHLSGHRVGYVIEERAYNDPFDRWRSRPPVDTRTLGVFATAGPGR